jgi:hypothetical protein
MPIIYPWGLIHEMVSIRLHGSTISVSLQQPCVCACLWSLSSDCFIRVISWSMSLSSHIYVWVLSFGNLNEILVLPRGIAPSMELWWFLPLNPTLTSLVLNLGYVSLGASPSEGVFQSSRILAQPTKSWWHESHIERTSTIKLMHCIIAVPYTIPYASWLQHRISITSQELFNLRKSVGIQYPSLSVSLITLSLLLVSAGLF